MRPCSCGRRPEIDVHHGAWCAWCPDCVDGAPDAPRRAVFSMSREALDIMWDQAIED